jgi:acetylornithine/N-succinyldiaminopimelate aminotransferase
MAASGKPQWQTLFGQAVPGFRKALFGDLDSVRELADDRVCAVMVEPVQGEGGVNVAPPEFITGLRQLCDELGLLLILDEVQTGMGRTGKLFAHEHYGVVPDILTLGKGIGGGFPLSAMLVSEAYDIFDPGDQGGTYTGQPLAMAAGLAVLETLVAPGFLEHVGEMSEYTARRLEELATTHEVTGVRGLGLLQAFDLEQSRGADVVKACLADGLIINSPKDSTIRLMPPLIVEPDDVDEMVEILARQLATR